MTINDYRLNELAAEIAAEIISECHDDRDTATDRAWEIAVDHPFAVVYHKAHELCQNCNTDNGEQFYEQYRNGWTTTGLDNTYNGIASIIAYGELYARIEQAIDAKIDKAKAAK